MIFITEERIKEIKKKVESDIYLKRELKELAEKSMKVSPLSVTFHKSPAVTGNPHDFYSEGPYWWPDPENPDGPYIKRDGEFNPDRFNAHMDDLFTFTSTVSILCQVGFYLDRRDYLDRAAELINVWFIDEDTKVNPHMECGQAIRGVCDGRGIGIIDTSNYIKVVYGADILERVGGYQKTVDGLKEWFRQYITWLTTSEKGLEEKNFFNNHSNWWNTQVAVFSAFTGDDNQLSECFDSYRNRILSEQTDTEGKFVDEITRTRSYHYTLYNMDACTIIAEVAYHRGVDLWNYETVDGKSLKKCVEFFKPYYKNPFLWKYPEINAEECHLEKMSLKLAAVRFDDAEIERTNIIRRKNIVPGSQMCFLGIMDLI